MTREINIRLNANRAKVVHTGYKFASGDKGIVFKIAVEELETAGTTAKIVFKRSNGTSVEASVEGEDGIYSYTTLGNEFAVIGLVVADVKFYEGEKRISTCTFDFGVTSDTMEGIGAGTAGYSDTLERMKESMEQTESEMLAVETRAEEILQQMRETAEGAEDDVEAAEKKMADLMAELEALYREYEEAFGTSGPFNPRGAYSAIETYTVRDMVTYNDASWICYRNCTGATPSEGSNCWQKLAIQVVDAQTLGGHEAEYFAPAESVLFKRVPFGTDTRDCIEEGLYFFSGLATNYVNVPRNTAHNGIMKVHYASDGSNLRVVQRWTSLNENKTYECTSLGADDWKSWNTTATTADLIAELAKYLPLTGGTVDGHLFVASLEAVDRMIYLQNSMRSVFQKMHSNGLYQLYDKTNNKAIIESTLDGTTTVNGTATGNIAREGGGVITSPNITFFGLKSTGGNQIYQRFEGVDGIMGHLGFNANIPVYVNTLGTPFPLLHTANSAKVHIGTSAPSDTASLWYDTANKKVKAYIDGAWTAAA